MDHAHTVNRNFSWRGGALALTLLVVIAAAGLGGMALVDHMGKAAPATLPQSVSSTHTVPLRPRSHISVLVLNGNGLNGAAGKLASRLLARGYAHAVSTDAANHVYATSLVLFRRGWGDEAARLAKDARIGMVAPLDSRLAPLYARDQVVVILGR